MRATRHMHRRAAASGAHRVDHAPLAGRPLHQSKSGAAATTKEAHSWHCAGTHRLETTDDVISPSELQLISWPPIGVWGREKRRGGGARGGEGAGAPATPMAVLLLARSGRRGAMVDRIRERLISVLCPFLQKGGRLSGILTCLTCTWDLHIALVEMAPAK